MTLESTDDDVIGSSEAPLTYNIEEAGRLLGISRNGAYDAARRGEIPVLRIGGRLLVPRKALHQMLENVGVATNGD